MSFKVREQVLHNALSDSCSVGCAADILTSLGIETEVFEDALTISKGVVIGLIEAIEPHPNADKLNVCQVRTSDSQVSTIVCGCSSVYVGKVVPVALPGTQLPKVLIESSELRGVLSHGMLCSASELGFDVTSKGLLELPKDAPLGDSLASYLNVDTSLLSIDLTPNRVDCASVLGLVRELSAKLNTTYDLKLSESIIEWQSPEQLMVHPTIGSALCMVKMTNLTDRAQTPAHIISSLSDAGIACIHPVVDVLNYVMILTGQPMHAYDLDHISLPLKLSEVGQCDVTVSVLSGDEQKLSAKDLVIRDEAHIHSIAGIIGCQRSRISDETSSFVLESAHFPSQDIACTSQRLCLNTDAAYRFERGVDPAGSKRAMAIAVSMLVEYCGVTLERAEAYEAVVNPQVISFRPSHFESLIGVSVAHDRMLAILRSLGFQVHVHGDHLWEVVVPSFRVDVTQAVDLIEEICRFVGYDNLTSNEVTNIRSSFSGMKIMSQREAFLKQRLAANGYSEIIAYSFVSQKLLADFGYHDPIMLQNPISSKFEAMRPSLLPSMVMTAEENARHGEKRIKLFELAKTYHKTGGKEQLKLAMLVCGDVGANHWSKPSFDSAQFKQEVMQIVPELIQCQQANTTRADYLNQYAALEWLHPETQELVATIGVLHPAVAKQYKIKQNIWVFEVSLDALHSLERRTANTVFTHPSITHDITFTSFGDQVFADIERLIHEAGVKDLVAIDLLDVYHPDGLSQTDAEQLTIRLTFNGGHRNLTDDDVLAGVSSIKSLLSREKSA